MNITTRGCGRNGKMVTRGYGRSIIERVVRVILYLNTAFTQRIGLSTDWTCTIRRPSRFAAPLLYLATALGRCTWLTTITIQRALRLTTALGKYIRRGVGWARRILYLDNDDN